MRDLYARFILFLIRPALERHKPELDPRYVVDSMIKDLLDNGPYVRASRGSQ